MTTPAKTRLRYSQADRKRGLSNAGRSDDLLLSIISDYQEASKYRLTPSRLVQIIADADAGDPREQAALFPTLLEKEPLLAAHLNTRRLAVLSKPWRVQSEKQPERAEEITDALSRAGLQFQFTRPRGARRYMMEQTAVKDGSSSFPRSFVFWGNHSIFKEQ